MFKAKLNSLRARRRLRGQAFEAITLRMTHPDYEENLADQKSYEELRSEIDSLDAEIKRVERAAFKAGKAVVCPDQYRPPAAPRRNTGLRAFKDFLDVHGEVIRAEECAFGFGQFINATLYGNERAQEWCRGRGILKAQGEGIDSTGGVLVPEEWMNTIIDLKEQFGIFARNAQKVTMTSDSVNWPRRTGGVNAYFIGEGVAPTESQATWDNVNLTAKKLAALIRLSTELAEDALINVADWVVAEIAYAFASKEDDCGFLGDGTSTYGGIQGLKTQFATFPTGVYTATGHTTVDTLTAAA